MKADIADVSTRKEMRQFARAEFEQHRHVTDLGHIRYLISVWFECIKPCHLLTVASDREDAIRHDEGIANEFGGVGVKIGGFGAVFRLYISYNHEISRGTQKRKGALWTRLRGVCISPLLSIFKRLPFRHNLFRDLSCSSTSAVVLSDCFGDSRSRFVLSLPQSCLEHLFD